MWVAVRLFMRDPDIAPIIPDEVPAGLTFGTREELGHVIEGLRSWYKDVLLEKHAFTEPHISFKGGARVTMKGMLSDLIAREQYTGLVGNAAVGKTTVLHEMIKSWCSGASWNDSADPIPKQERFDVVMYMPLSRSDFNDGDYKLTLAEQLHVYWTKSGCKLPGIASAADVVSFLSGLKKACQAPLLNKFRVLWVFDELDRADAFPLLQLLLSSNELKYAIFACSRDGMLHDLKYWKIEGFMSERRQLLAAESFLTRYFGSLGVQSSEVVSFAKRMELLDLCETPKSLELLCIATALLKQQQMLRIWAAPQLDTTDALLEWLIRCTLAGANCGRWDTLCDRRWKVLARFAHETSHVESLGDDPLVVWKRIASREFWMERCGFVRFETCTWRAPKIQAFLASLHTQSLRPERGDEGPGTPRRSDESDDFLANPDTPPQFDDVLLPVQRFDEPEELLFGRSPTPPFSFDDEDESGKLGLVEALWGLF